MSFLLQDLQEEHKVWVLQNAVVREYYLFWGGVL